METHIVGERLRAALLESAVRANTNECRGISKKRMLAYLDGTETEIELMELLYLAEKLKVSSKWLTGASDHREPR